MPLNDLEQRLRHSIERRDEAMRGELAAHVAIPTGHNHVPGLNEYRQRLVDRLKSLGAEITMVQGEPRPPWLQTSKAEHPEQDIPPTALATRRAIAKTPRVLIAGHIDTVHDPHGSFQQLIVSAGGRAATGPGAADMKGGIVVALFALEALAECGVDLNWTFLLNSDEETGSFHSMNAITRAAREHDVGIALEPALPDGSLVVQRMGAGQFKVEAFGRAAHVGRDFAHGVSAVYALGEALVKLSGMSDAERGMIVNVGPLRGGPATNIVPDDAACWGNMRFADEAAAERLQRSIAALATPDDALPRVAVDQIINRPSKPLTHAVRELAEAARTVAQDLGQQLPFGKTGGVCDGNIMQAAGLPTIDTLGVRGGNLHRTDEFIELASLVERAQLLAVLLAHIARGDVHITA